MNKAGLRKWYESTSPKQPGISADERAIRMAYRSTVITAADTSLGSIRVGLCRDQVGAVLLGKMRDAIEKHGTLKDYRDNLNG